MRKGTLFLVALMSVFMFSACAAGEMPNLDATKMASPSPSPSLPSTVSVHRETPAPTSFQQEEVSPIPLHAAYSEVAGVFFLERLLTGQLRSSFEILGGYADQAWGEWLDYGFGEPARHGLTYYEEEESDLPYTDEIKENCFVHVDDHLFIYDVDGNRCEIKVDSAPHIYEDEGGLFLSAGFSPVEGQLQNRDYLGVSGDWNPMPRRFREIDEIGSLAVDLDGDSVEEQLLIKVEAVEGLMKEHLVFSIMTEHEERVLTGRALEEIPTEEYYGDYHHSAYFWPFDANGDGIMEIFLIAYSTSTYNVFMFDFGDPSGAPALHYEVLL